MLTLIIIVKHLIPDTKIFPIIIRDTIIMTTKSLRKMTITLLTKKPMTYYSKN